MFAAIKALFLCWYCLTLAPVHKGDPIATPGAGVGHPFYISVTEINHNAKEKTLEISCKMFAEDFEQVLEKDYKTQLDIADPKQKPVLDKLIPDYIIHHLTIWHDGKQGKLSFVGYEKDKESAYCYFQISDVPLLNKITVNNSLLHDFNTGQINIIHVMANGKRQSTKLDYPDVKADFNF